MSTSLCKSSVFNTYQEVINDVISNTREHFVEDGVDDVILQELKQLWEAKLAATKAVDQKSKETDKPIGKNKPLKNESNNGSKLTKNSSSMTKHKPQSHQQYSSPHQLHLQQVQPPPLQPPLVQPPQSQYQQVLPEQCMVQQQLKNRQVVGQVPPNNHMPQGPMGQAFPEWKRVPIQLTIPPAPGTGEGNRILSIDVPEVLLHSHHLKSILTGEVISTTLQLPLATACAFIQDHVNAAFLKHQQQTFYNWNNMNPSMSMDASRNDQSQKNIPQRDGPADSFDDDEDLSEDSSSNDDNEIENDIDVDEMEKDCASRVENDSLNSEDDVSDADGTGELLGPENVIVCQFMKIARSRNRWKFYLKDGIMNLKGKDFIFVKANGEAEW